MKLRRVNVRLRLLRWHAFLPGAGKRAAARVSLRARFPTRFLFEAAGVSLSRLPVARDLTAAALCSNIEHDVRYVAIVVRADAQCQREFRQTRANGGGDLRSGEAAWRS